jgi:hypothetical protein
MCSYYAKGSADYVGVWDFDEFFQPRGLNKNLLDVIDSVEPAKDAVPFAHDPRKTSLDVYRTGWKPARGMADKDGHPFCYLVLNSEVTMVPKSIPFETEPVSATFLGDPYSLPLLRRMILLLSSYPIFIPSYSLSFPSHPILFSSLLQVLLEDPWIGKVFAHGHEPFGHGMGFKKSIRPTRNVFQGGLHLAGACHLPNGWNGCAKDHSGFCYHHKRPFSRLQYDDNLNVIDFHLTHYFDEIVLDTDAKFIDSKVEGVLNHVQYRRMHNEASPGALATKGEYATNFFPEVYEALERRSLVMPFELPELSTRPFPNPDVTWLDHIVLNAKIEEAKEKSKTQSHVWLDADNLNSPLSQISLRDIMPGNASSSSTSRRLQRVETGEEEARRKPEAFLDYLEDSQEANEDYAALPAFSIDKSELFLASMVEREDDTWNLYLTTFLLNRRMSKADKSKRTCHNVRSDKETLKSWGKHIMSRDDVAYEESGCRGPLTKYYCRIRATSSDQYYTVPGSYLDTIPFDVYVSTAQICLY